jgi:hypothetical protein
MSPGETEDRRPGEWMPPRTASYCLVLPKVPEQHDSLSSSTVLLLLFECEILPYTAGNAQSYRKDTL